MAKRSPNGSLSHIQSELLNFLADELDKEVKTECRNTEEMLAALEETNKLDNIKKLVVWSMDVEKLYPSLKAEEVSKLVGKAFLESKLEVNVNTEDLSLYLALTVPRKELVKRGLARVTHTRKSQANNAPPGITPAEVFARQRRHEETQDDEEDAEVEGEEEEEKEVKSLFLPPKASPTNLQKKKMIALAIEVGIKATMQGHMYQMSG